MDYQQCTRHNLAEGLRRGYACRIDRCSCGHVHLVIGALTLRIDEETLRGIGMVMAAAIAKLDERPQPPAMDSKGDAPFH
ncbi:MAG: hypothetical protein AAGC55_19435 [Myxococcota bacterium]